MVTVIRDKQMMSTAPEHTQMTGSNAREIYFINPHQHHSYFTVLALSKVSGVKVLCPPLALQRACGTWQENNNTFPSFPRLDWKSKLAQSAALFAFILFKLHFINEKAYLLLFSWCSHLFLHSRKHRLLVYYQDYLPQVHSPAPCFEKRICEIIIGSNPASDNYRTTINSIDNADIIIAPNINTCEYLNNVSKKVFIAPYGGNKSDYLRSRDKANSHNAMQQKFKNEEYPEHLIIAARAPTFRKGADILLQSLRLVNTCLAQSTYSPRRVHVYICGSIEERAIMNLFEEVKKELDHHRIIALSAKQYSHRQYVNLLQKSHLFVMPSRLESCSLAALEALWHGTPSLLSIECGVEEFRDDVHGKLLSPVNDESLAKAMLSILSYPQILQKWRLNLINSRHLFCWDSYQNTYEQCIRQMLAIHPEAFKRTF